MRRPLPAARSHRVRAGRCCADALAYTPLAFADSLARWYVRLLDLALPRLRRVALANLDIASGLSSKGRMRASPMASSPPSRASWSAFARFPQIHRDNVAANGFATRASNISSARKPRGKGVLFATAHLGNWELSAFAHALMAEPMHIVVRPLDNPLHRPPGRAPPRALSGNRLIEKKDAARAILRALQPNEAVGILIDQNTTLATASSSISSASRPAPTPAFARLAAHTGAAVIPGFALWSEAERRYVLRFYPPVAITGDVQEDTARLHRGSKPSSANIPISGCGFTGAGRRGRREKARRTERRERGAASVGGIQGWAGRCPAPTSQGTG